MDLGSDSMLGKNDPILGLLRVRVTYTQVGPIGQKAYMGQNIHLHYSNIVEHHISIGTNLT